jgi:CheY-like chemotaxis protein
VRSAASAREALEVLLTWTPDVLVLDISMPDMDGYELLSAIRGSRAYARFRPWPLRPAPMNATEIAAFRPDLSSIFGSLTTL